MRAIFLSSDDMFKIESSIRFKTQGPRIAPVRIIPTSPGSPTLFESMAAAIPTNMINAILNNISSSS